MSSPLKRLPRLIGLVIAIACAGFVLWRFAALLPGIRQVSNGPELLKRISLSSLIYAAGCLLLAAAWALLLKAFAGSAVPLASSASLHMRSQIAKYLPGNVFHLAARHVRARRLGLGHMNVAAAALAESGILVLTAIVLSMAIPIERVPASLQWLAGWKWLIGVLLSIALVFAHWILRRRFQHDSSFPNLGRSLAFVAGAATFYAGFFVLAAAAFRELLNDDLGSDVTILPVIALSWLGGFLVVGAPGGIGVREALLVSMLAVQLGEAHALYAALTFRAVSILGDVVVFLVGWAMNRIGTGDLAKPA